MLHLDWLYSCFSTLLRLLLLLLFLFFLLFSSPSFLSNRLSIRLSACPFVQSCVIRSSDRAFVRPSVHPFLPQFLRPFVPLFVLSCINSRPPSFVSPLVCPSSFAPSVVRPSSFPFFLAFFPPRCFPFFLLSLLSLSFLFVFLLPLPLFSLSSFLRCLLVRVQISQSFSISLTVPIISHLGLPRRPSKCPIVSFYFWISASFFAFLQTYLYIYLFLWNVDLTRFHVI